MRRAGIALTLAMVVASALTFSTVTAHAPSGAIFTTSPTGEVNKNIFSDKNLVYLDGGPGPGAPPGAAGLDPGTYIFQVTDPSGKTLLSTDPARCRQAVVGSGGFFTGVVAAGGCEHPILNDVDQGILGAKIIKLMPFNDTPNNGGVYKAWVTEIGDFLAGCRDAQNNPSLTLAQALALVDCGNKQGGNAHGFVGGHTKTDNFKVKEPRVREIDTRFLNDKGQLVDGLGVTWTDTNGAKNRKYSYYRPALEVFHEAHIEAPEDGVHYVTIDNQPGCTVYSVRVDYGAVRLGPQTVAVAVRPNDWGHTFFIDVECL